MERPKMEEEPQKQIEQPELKPQKSSFINNYVTESSISQLEELLSEGQLSKMMKRLEEDIQGASQVFLINNFKEVFEQ